MVERYDGDSEESRDAFRAYDENEPVFRRSAWQIWRDACAWQAARTTADRATALEESAAICQCFAVEALDSYTTEAGRTAAHGALICAMGEIRNLRAGSVGAEQSKDKWVAIVRVTNEGYAMELSKYIAYALPEGTHELYATPQALQSRDSLIEECAAVLDRRINGWRARGKTILNGQTVADELEHHAHAIRALKSQQDAAIESTSDSVDAKRYRWLREQQWNVSNLFVIAGSHSQIRLGTDCPTHERLDEAIDEQVESQRSGDGS